MTEMIPECAVLINLKIIFPHVIVRNPLHTFQKNQLVIVWQKLFRGRSLSLNRNPTRELTQTENGIENYFLISLREYFISIILAAQDVNGFITHNKCLWTMYSCFLVSQTL